MSIPEVLAIFLIPFSPFEQQLPCASSQPLSQATRKDEFHPFNQLSLAHGSFQLVGEILYQSETSVYSMCMHLSVGN